MKFSIRDLLRVTVIVATVHYVATSTIFARPVRRWTQQELIDEADIVVIATASESKKTENSDGFMPNELQQFESELLVRSIFKGKDVDPALKEKGGKKVIKFVHFRYREDLKTSVDNGPGFAVLGTAKVVGRIPSALPFYLLYLRKRKDGRYEPVTGNNDPQNSISRILVFERDPASPEGKDH
jgi:hypothetical protein